MEPFGKPIDIYATKELEHLLVLVFLAMIILFWRFVLFPKKREAPRQDKSA